MLQDIPKKGDTLALKEPIDPANFLPVSKSYWTYLGSLTTPPLYESVTWIVFKQPIEISSVQLKIMRDMKFGDDKSENMRDNYRWETKNQEIILLTYFINHQATLSATQPSGQTTKIPLNLI